jgi:ferric-dicitrate binding protein FerR (iron transport regulator)
MKGNNKHYHNYTFEDLLQDDYFISSVNNPTEETTAFWNAYLQANPPGADEYMQAKSYIESMPFNKDRLSSEEISELWNSIQTANSRPGRSGKCRRRLVTATIGVVAACLAGVMLVPSFFKSANEKEADIYTFANKAAAPDYRSSSAQLILSEDKTILLDEKESTIVYDSACIKVCGNKENLSKKGIASYNQLIVPKGKRSSLTLSDGTRIWINSGTRVIYPAEFDSRERELYVDGEIYIQVAHDKSRPFTVKTKDIGINVLGTEFNVTAYESDGISRVILTSGSIRLTNKHHPEDILLSPNKMYQYYNNACTVESVDVSKYISWKEGMYIFENERLDIIFKRLSHYYGVDITCDQGSASLKCSGKLDLKNNIEDVIKGLTYTVPITYMHDGQNNEFIIELNP